MTKKRSKSVNKKKKISAKVKAQFAKMFPRQSALGIGLETFAKCRKFIVGYVSEVLKRANIDEVDPLDFISSDNGKPLPELSEYAKKCYATPSSRSSQLSLAKDLATDELKEKNKGGGLQEQDVVFDPDKLKAHLREVWSMLPRRSRDSSLKPGKEREHLELTNYGKIFFQAFQAVDAKRRPSSVKELVVDNYQTLRHEVIIRVKRKYKAAALHFLYNFIHKRLKLKVKKNRPMFKLDQLPSPFREEVMKFIEQAGNGLGAIEEFEDLSKEHDVKNTEPFSKTSIDGYVRSVLIGAAYFDLPEGASIRDLMILVRKPGTRTFINSYVEKYRQAERGVERPAKRKNFDSVEYNLCISAICAIARFNGIFDLQEEFRIFHAAKLDRKSIEKRRDEKLAIMTCRWIDEEIEKLVAKFNEIIKTRSFLKRREDLELCLFLPQLLTMRVLGFRQQCLRHCEEGKNITFPKKGVVSWFYDAGEIKNEVAISQTFSVTEIKKIKLIKVLNEVLYDYKFKFLDVISAEHPAEYEERMGKSFFGVPDRTRGGCGVKRNRTGDKDVDYLVYTLEEKNGRNTVRDFFTRAADYFMNTEHLAGTDIFLNPHFLRAICVGWMKDELEMTWEEIEEAIGDREATLKRYYYRQKARIQNAARGFRRVSRDLEAKEPSVGSPVMDAAMNSMQKNLNILTQRTVKADERAEKAEKRADEAKELKSLAEERAAHHEKEEARWRAIAEYTMDKTGLSISDLPPELQPVGLT